MSRPPTDRCLSCLFWDGVSHACQRGQQPAEGICEEYVEYVQHKIQLPACDGELPPETEVGWTARARDLEYACYDLLTDSQDLEEIVSYLPWEALCDFTGAIVRVEDYGYSEIWLTESARPYDAYARYERVV
jgi:hypothetical protein